MLELKNNKKNNKIKDCVSSNCLEEIKITTNLQENLNKELDKILEKLKNKKVKL